MTKHVIHIIHVANFNSTLMLYSDTNACTRRPLSTLASVESPDQPHW